MLLLWSCVLSIALGAKAYAQELKVDMSVFEGKLPTQGETFYLGITVSTGSPKSTRLPLNVAFVVDLSPQTTPTTLSHIVDALKSIAPELDSGDIISLLSFDATVEVLLPPLTWPDSERFEASLAKLTPSQGSSLFAGVVKGASEVRRNLSREKVNRVIVISTSVPDTGPHQVSAFEQLARSLQREGISVTTIGVNTSFDENALLALARLSGGQYHFVPNEQHLVGLFPKGLKELSQMVSAPGNLSLKLAEGLRPVEIYSPWVDMLPRTASLQVRPMYPNDKEEFIVLVQRDTAAPLDGLLAEVEVRYYDPYTQQNRHAFGELNASSVENNREGVFLARLLHVLNQMRRLMVDTKPEDASFLQSQYRELREVTLSALDASGTPIPSQQLKALERELEYEQSLIGGPLYRKQVLRSANTPHALLTRKPF